MMRIPVPIYLACAALFCLGIDRCGSDPNLEGAKLDLSNKDYDRALENISKALEKNPNSSEAYFLKGDITRAIVVDTDQAEERAAYVEEMATAYRRSTELDASLSSEVNFNLLAAYRLEVTTGFEAYAVAQSVSDDEKPDAFLASARFFRNASIIMPDSVRPYFNEASAYYGGGMFPEAAETFEAAVSLGHTNRQLFVHWATVLNLMAEQLPGDAEKQSLYWRAAKVLHTGLDHHPEDAELRDMMLNYYALGDRLDEAISAFQMLYEDFREHPVHLYNYGTLLLRAGEYTSAIAHLSAVVDLDPDYTRARLNLGAALISEAERLAAEYTMLRDSLETLDRGNSASRVARIEARQIVVERQRATFLSDAISHLETARQLSADALEDPRDICRALVRAYGHANQRSKAEEVAQCAAYDVP